MQQLLNELISGSFADWISLRHVRLVAGVRHQRFLRAIAAWARRASMLARTLSCLRSKLGSLRSAGNSPCLLATSAAQRLQHADAFEACGDALQEFRETVKDFAQRTIAPHAAEIDRLNSFPTSNDLWKEIGDFGLHGAVASHSSRAQASAGHEHRPTKAVPSLLTSADCCLQA